MKKEVNMRLFGGVLLLFYLLGLIFPEPMWGTHFIAFLPFPFQALIWGLSVLLLLRPESLDFTADWGKKIQNIKWKAPLIALSYGLIFYAFPIYLDVYGDAQFIVGQKDLRIETFYNLHTELFWSFDFANPKLGTESTIGGVALFSYLLKVDVYTAYRIYDAFWGAGFIWLWLSLCKRLLSGTPWRYLAAFIGLTAPLLQNFFGHTEVYCDALFTATLFLFVLVRFFQTPKPQLLLVLLLSFVLALKFHVTNVLLFPGFVLAAFYQLQHYRPGLSTWMSWKKVVGWIHIPFAAVLAVLYFFVKKSHFGGRSYTPKTLGDVVFIPIKSREPAPLDNYNLFSFNHLLDYFNMTFLWSSAAIFVVVYLLVKYKKQLPWNNPFFLVPFALLPVYLLFFFVMNPLLGMQTDWDLFSSPGIVILFWCLLLMHFLRDQEIPQILPAHAVVFALFSCSIFFVNANPSTLYKRYLSLSKHQFKGYWIGASTGIQAAFELIPTQDKKDQLLDEILADLEPHATLGNDIEYAELLYQKGLRVLDTRGYPEAMPYFESSHAHSSLINKNIYQLVIGNFMLKRYDKANSFALRLIQGRYPDWKKAYRIAIHVRIMAEDFDQALTDCKSYLTKWPDEPFIQSVHDYLAEGVNLEEAQNLFKKN